MSEDEDTQNNRESGFHPRTSALTQDFVDHCGFRLAQTYGKDGVAEDYRACRERAALADLSALRKFEVLGPDAEALMVATMTRDVRRQAVGQVITSALCDEDGGVIDAGSLFRLGPDNFRWIATADRAGPWLERQAATLGLKVWIQPSTDRLHNLAVLGPKSREVLREVIWTPPAQPSLEELTPLRFAVGRLGNFDGRALVVSRTGVAGEPGYEVWCHPKAAVEVWDAIWQAGAPHGLAPVGLAALEILRIEAGLARTSAEITEETDPFEAGIGLAVDLDGKGDDFIGREALLRRKAAQQRMLAGLVLEDDTPAAQEDRVFGDGQEVGVVTSATRSPRLEREIALCRIDMAFGTSGNSVEIETKEGGRRPAQVTALPFPDPAK